MYDRDYGHSGVEVMFGKKKEQEPQLKHYIVNINDVETLEQLREFVKIVMRSLSTSGDAVIREDYLDEFPELAKISNLKNKVE